MTCRSPQLDPDRAIIGGASSAVLAILCVLLPQRAQAQAAAKVEPVTVTYCSYLDRSSNNDLTGYLVDGSSCAAAGEGALETVSYVVCGSTLAISVPRKDLKKSESGCDGVRAPSVVASIKGEVVDVTGEKVSVAYEASTGRQVVTIDKNALGGAVAVKNARVIFVPREAANAGDLKGFAKDFDIFKSIANNQQLPNATHGVRGVIINKF